MTVQEIFTIGMFSVVGLGVFMFFLWGIIQTICDYKENRRTK